MNRFRDNVIIGCLAIAIVMTLFPPQTIEKRRYGEPYDQIEYRFIGDQGDGYGKISITFDRLIFQYAIIVVAGYILFLLKRKNQIE